MTKACVIGWPIEHSRSPVIHNYWLKSNNIQGSYVKEAVPPEELESFLQSLGDKGYAGCNVTVPHKGAAFQIASDKDEAAVAVGAANTLWLEGNVLHASNTDTYGFMTYLGLQAPEWNKRDAPVSILGAGGAARAIVHGFLDAGVSQVNVFNRSIPRAQALAAHFGEHVIAHDWDGRNDKSVDAGVLVNTTSVGMNNECDLGIDVKRLHPDCCVADIVYVPLQTALLRDAQAVGLATVDGLGMLLHQAVPGFERWFGLRPEVTADLYGMIAAGLETA